MYHLEEIPLTCSVRGSLLARKHDVFGGAPSAESSCGAGDALFPPSSCSHQPPTEPRSPHGPRLPGDATVAGANAPPRTSQRTAAAAAAAPARQSTSHMARFCPQCAVNSLSSFKITSLSANMHFPPHTHTHSVGWGPAGLTDVNHPDELSALKPPLAWGRGNRGANACDQRGDGERG